MAIFYRLFFINRNINQLIFYTYNKAYNFLSIYENKARYVGGEEAMGSEQKGQETSSNKAFNLL